GVGGGRPGQRPHPFTHIGAGPAQRLQRPLTGTGEGVDQPGHRRIGGHRPEPARLGPPHRPTGQALAPQPPRPPPLPPHPARNAPSSPLLRTVSTSSTAPAWETTPRPPLSTPTRGQHPIRLLTSKVPSGLARTAPSTSPILPAQGHPSYLNGHSRPTARGHPGARG